MISVDQFIMAPITNNDSIGLRVKVHGETSNVPIANKRGADAAYSERKRIDESYTSHCHSDQILVDTESLVDLKLQLASQREKLDIVSSQLSLCQIENEALKAENEELQLSIARDAIEEQSVTSATAAGGFFA